MGALGVGVIAACSSIDGTELLNFLFFPLLSALDLLSNLTDFEIVVEEPLK